YRIKKEEEGNRRNKKEITTKFDEEPSIMHMQKKNTITLNRISFLEEIDIKDLFNALQSHPYDEKEGIGFTTVNENDDIIEATIIIRIPTQLQEFDSLSGTFTAKNIYIFDEISFFLDLTSKLIYSLCSISKLNKVKSLLKTYIKHKVIYENLHLNPKKIIANIELDNFESMITELVIKKFAYKDGAQGKFVAHISNPNLGYELLNTYLDEIQKVTLEIESKDYERFVLTISTNNSISIKCEEDDFWYIFNNLKAHI
ncbi:hypothetical protein AAH161_19695, partial [Bacteroides ovatus]|uniref:hypothetical protein n=2 Tax=Bacteroides ovatus TaxID=28116 RepID=UPI0039B6D715